MQFDTPLTREGRERLRKAVVEYESLGYEWRREALQEELGAERFSKGHVYLLPCIHEGRRLAESRGKENYILKVCDDCAKGKTVHWENTQSSRCFIDHELGVWETAVRRGDDDLLCPIHDAEQRDGWMLMEQCDDLIALPDDHPYDDLEVLNPYHANQCIARRLRERGWLPKSADKMDVEAMVYDGRLVAIDYEKLYHADWMYDPLDWHRSYFLRRDSPHTATSVLEIDKNDALEGGRPSVWSWMWKVVKKEHYSVTWSRSKIEREAIKLKREERGAPSRKIQRERSRIKHMRDR